MSEFRHIVRVAGVDLPGGKKISMAMQKIGGVGIAYANAIVRLAGVKDTKAGEMTDEDLKKIEEVLKNPDKYQIPSWLFNRRKDFDTGKDIHIMGAGLAIHKREDVNRLQKTKTYRGIRHALGLRLRGQRTRSSGRKGSTVGVRRKGVPGQRPDKAKK